MNSAAAFEAAVWARSLGRGVQAVAFGALLGGVVAAGNAAGLGSRGGAELRGIADALTARIGPVWIAMLGVLARVVWLSARAFATRFGRGGLHAPVRPELVQLAPLFAALGLCGTVWGLARAFGALEQGAFLTQLPLLLGGLGAAMTSTLAGLGLQIGTLLLSAFNPAWSTARVVGRASGVEFWLDGRRLGGELAGFVALAEALHARQPEALRIEFSGEVPVVLKKRVGDELWRRIDGAIPVRVVS